MKVHDRRMSEAVVFELNDGRLVWPAEMRCNKTGKIAFRVSPGGTRGNTMELTQHVDEATMIRMVREHGYCVRCKERGAASPSSLYRPKGKEVREVRYA